MHKIVIPTLEEFSGKKAGVDFGVCNNPEFLREGSAVKDFHSPPKTVIGELDHASGDMLAALYEKLEAPLIRTDLETAEMVKYVDNSWHALKIGFANEIGNLCKSLGLDAHEVMKIFCQDRKLNISPAYLLPGFAFGGSCLPKDLAGIGISGQNARSAVADSHFHPAEQRNADRPGPAAHYGKGAHDGWAFWALVSKREQTICGRAP